MKLEQIPCKALAKAKSVFVFPSHLVGCTGKKAVLLDREQNLIHTIEGLSYVYFAAISPDESQLLLISNEKYFYVVDLHSFEKRRIAVKAPWELLADTRGCWSSDGASVYIPVYRGEVSTLRNYRAADPSVYEDVLSGKYVLRTIQWVPSRKAYFLCGYGRQEKKQNYFIWYDGAAFTAYPVQEPPGTMIFMAKAEEKDPSVTMISNHGCFRMSPEGQILEKVEHPSLRIKSFPSFPASTICSTEMKKKRDSFWPYRKPWIWSGFLRLTVLPNTADPPTEPMAIWPLTVAFIFWMGRQGKFWPRFPQNTAFIVLRSFLRGCSPSPLGPQQNYIAFRNNR